MRVTLMSLTSKLLIPAQPQFTNKQIEGGKGTIVTINQSKKGDIQPWKGSQAINEGSGIECH